MDLVKLCLSPLCSCLQRSPDVRQRSYVFHPKEKLDDLENAKKDLMAKKMDIQRKLDDLENAKKDLMAKKNDIQRELDKEKLPNSQLQRCLHKVGEKDDKVKQLLDKYRKGTCVAGFCSLNCFSRYKISKDAIKLSHEISQLKGEQLGDLFIEQHPPPKPFPESYKPVGRQIGSNVDIARSYLADETAGMMGIWGMGGVGKTTLLKKIYNSLLDDGNTGFDHVLFVAASQNIQLDKLREKIAEMLKLASSAGKDEIFNFLKTKNFVLFLDNIWKEVELKDLGIPHPNSVTAQYKHKVIFTARSEDVCAKMKASKRIKVECLEPDEAWDLFKENVNLDVIESNERINEIAKQVMNVCSGLPLALKVIGKAMSNQKTLPEWKFVLGSLQNSSPKAVPCLERLEESLYPILKLSYDNLPDKIRKFFLYASILRGKSKYEQLECLMGLGLIADFGRLQAAYEEAESILKVLEASCLLYFSPGDDGCVRLVDVIYEMAKRIASDYKWIVKEYNFAEIPTNDAENWQFANRVIIGGIRLLPILSHQCFDLLSLMILNSIDLKNIPEGFFRQMPNLTYLDLSGTGIEELPKDIKCLVNLQYLNISSTCISSLPKELVYLNKLQYLICRNLLRLSNVEDGLMSRLQKLKVIDLYPYGWVEPEELKILKKHIKAIGMRVVSQEVFQQLSCLPTTQLHIENLDNLISLSFDSLSCKNHGFLQSLEIVSCPQLEELVMNGSETHLNKLIIDDVKKLQNIIWTDISPPKYFHMLKRLCISKCNLASFAWVLHLPCLYHLEIRNCAEIEELFYVEEDREIQQISERPIFPRLECLELANLPKLLSINNSALDFPRLSRLSVSGCLNLKKLPFKSGINNSKTIAVSGDATIPSHLSPSHPPRNIFS